MVVLKPFMAYMTIIEDKGNKKRHKALNKLARLEENQKHVKPLGDKTP